MSPEFTLIEDPIDDERHVLIVHHVDASDPAAIRARHATARKRDQGPVVR